MVTPFFVLDDKESLPYLRCRVITSPNFYLRPGLYVKIGAGLVANLCPVQTSCLCLSLWSLKRTYTLLGALRNFTAEARRTQRRQGEGKFYVSLAFFALRSSVSLWLFFILYLAMPTRSHNLRCLP